MPKNIVDILSDEWQERGMSLAELSRRSGVSYHRLRRAFNEGVRLRYEDAVAVAKALKVELR